MSQNALREIFHIMDEKGSISTLLPSGGEYSKRTFVCEKEFYSSDVWLLYLNII